MREQVIELQIHSLIPVQVEGTVNYFSINGEYLQPLYTDGYVRLDNGGYVKIPGQLHEGGFDKTPESFDIITEKNGDTITAMVTTNLTKHTVIDGSLYFHVECID